MITTFLKGAIDEYGISDIIAIKSSKIDKLYEFNRDSTYQLSDNSVEELIATYTEQNPESEIYMRVENARNFTRDNDLLEKDDMQNLYEEIEEFLNQ